MVQSGGSLSLRIFVPQVFVVLGKFPVIRSEAVPPGGQAAGGRHQLPLVARPAFSPRP